MAAAEAEQCSDRDRFHLDLEFVQCLASPEYVLALYLLCPRTCISISPCRELVQFCAGT